ncbi:ABC transporter ATP-binding protein [Effusibacillus consociatus]|uniref:ABC transporter ATP-binding protein n=1 Tax=Effusibacillus consociatus TaxID=1117041 RepID=A0ABV9Q138_9BACL
MKVLKVKDVHWIRSDKQILSHVNWEVNAKEHWAIIGLNGSGKTSLLKMITGYEWPSRGTIQVLGHPYGQCDIREVRKSIGWVSSALREEFYPSDSALDVVVSGKYASIGLWETVESSDRERAFEELAKFGCSHLAAERYGTLSQGEKQKVLLARALMSDPKLLILDEPCFGLDIRARENVLSVINRIGSSANAPTLLYVTHHVEEIQPIFTHALLMEEGQVVASGPKRTVLTGDYLSGTFGLNIQVDWLDDRPWIRSVNSVE